MFQLSGVREVGGGAVTFLLHPYPLRPERISEVVFSLPYKLSNLALESFSKFISQLMVKLVTLSQDTTVEDFETRYLIPACQALEEMIHTTVPPTLANEVTDKFLTCVLKTYNDLDNIDYKLANPGREYVDRHRLCQEVALQIGCATFHPCTTVFQYYKNYDGSPFSYDALNFMYLYLDKVLSKAQHIRSLQLMVEQFNKRVILDGIMPVQNLEEFTLYRCTDSLLEALANSSSSLRCLEVSNSRNVTDASVEHLLKFRNLRRLDISNTSISRRGVTKILRGMPQAKRRGHRMSLKLALTSLKSELTPSQVKLLPTSFPNLTSLDFQLTEGCNLKPLKRLKHLTCLTLGYFSYPVGPYIQFMHAEDLLREIGGQLMELKLNEVKGANLNFIAEHCPNLRCLGLLYTNTENMGFPERLSLETYSTLYPVPAFPSVRCLDLKVYNCSLSQHLVSSMQCLRKVKLWWFVEPFESLIKNMIARMEDGSLEEIEVNGNKVKLSRNWGVVTSFNGSTVVVNSTELEAVVRDLCKGVHVEYMNRLVRVV